jgi:hypothetical protein
MLRRSLLVVLVAGCAASHPEMRDPNVKQVALDISGVLPTLCIEGARDKAILAFPIEARRGTGINNMSGQPCLQNVGWALKAAFDEDVQRNRPDLRVVADDKAQLMARIDNLGFRAVPTANNEQLIDHVVADYRFTLIGDKQPLATLSGRVEFSPLILRKVRIELVLGAMIQRISTTLQKVKVVPVSAR